MRIELWVAVLVLAGCSGSTTGSTGSQGERGPQGERGLQGPQGLKGETGSRGEQGLKGDTGPAGPQGERGDQGLPGVQGPKGDAGSQGPKGDKGDTGSPGPAGVSTSANGTRLKLAYIESLDGATQPFLNRFWDTTLPGYCTVRGAGSFGLRCIPGKSAMTGESDIVFAGLVGQGPDCSGTPVTLIKKTAGSWSSGTEYAYAHTPEIDPVVGGYVIDEVYRLPPNTGTVYWMNKGSCVVAPSSVRAAETVTPAWFAEITVNHD